MLEPGLDRRESESEWTSVEEEITRLLADNPEPVSPGDVAAAVNGHRSAFELPDRGAPPP
jgi:hypothetical protein